jgi:hypothetical protein
MNRIYGLVALAALSACHHSSRKVAVAKPAVSDWKQVVTQSDTTRLRGWRDAFVAALAEARASGAGARIAREGALLVPDAAMAPVDFPGGRYRCRVIKLGAKGTGMAAYTPYPAYDCIVNEQGDGGGTLTKLTGSQRPAGRFFDDGPARKIFLGAMMLGDETRPFDYGRDATRDMAGAIQRIGPRRWRLILPYPRFESVMDVIELVPAV